ncbi:T9SS type A sorting domain-containing protein [Hymenobacter aquaticus]|uniref:T9SS type A sorting domain-containing protein n=1 Tax=Hymenobacter aquaticus TaxID=1867101 RepID=A0A4Z0PSF5_9BACT|nr:T9SS type A sorting domain-containing protein [Hymenobacter aquaticus]TGE20608.1 T9SS type A sorting domain-containing protein [Hymenobacter aquaticus]
MMKLTRQQRALGLGAALLLLGGLPAAQAQTQQPATCITTPDVVSGQPNWNWEVDLYDPNYRKTWSAYTYSSAVGSNSSVVMGAPWNTNSTEQLAQIAATRDYTKAKGWQLLRVNFGCAAAEEHPWFVLYNKYTGVIRVYIWLNNVNNMNQGAMISLKQSGFRITALGSNANVLRRAPDSYLTTSPNPDTDYVSVLVTTAGSVKWASADFQTTLDPNVGNSAYTGSELVFQIHAIQKSTVDLAGQFKFTTEEATPALAGAPTPTPNVARGSTFVADSKKVIANVNSGLKGAQKVLGQINSGALEVKKFVAKGASTDATGRPNLKQYVLDLATTVADLTTPPNGNASGSAIQSILKKALKVGSGVASAIPALSFLGPVLGIMFPSDDETAAKSIPFTPTISTGEMSLKGTIETITSQNTLRIQTPGTVHNDAVRPTLPYYNCPLGVFNISNTPVLLKSAPRTVLLERGYYDEYDDWNRQWYQQPFTTNMDLVVYKLNNDLNPVFNASAGVTPLSVQGALVFRRHNRPSDSRNGDYGTAATDLLADPYTYYDYAMNTHVTSSSNPMLQQFEAGNLTVNTMNASSIEFQTPFVNVNCLKGVTAQVPADVSVFVRVRAMFTRNDAPSEPPIVLVYDYAVQETPNANVTHAYPVAGSATDYWPVSQPGSGYQTLGIYGDEFSPLVFGTAAGSAGNNLVVRAGNSIEVEGTVHIPAGSTMAFTTEFQPVSCTTNSLAASVSGTGCEAYAQTWWRPEKVLAAAQPETAPTRLEVFPNPTRGAFSVEPHVAAGETVHLTVHNLLGQQLYAQDYVYQGHALLVTHAALPTGMYVVKVSSAKTGVRTATLQVN